MSSTWGEINVMMHHLRPPLLLGENRRPRTAPAYAEYNDDSILLLNTNRSRRLSAAKVCTHSNNQLGML